MFETSYRCYENIPKIRALPKNAELDKLAAQFLELRKITEEPDVAPTTQVIEAIAKFDKLRGKVRLINAQDCPNHRRSTLN